MALMKRPNFTVYDRWGAFVDRIRGITAAAHKDGLDGTDELTITCHNDLSKGERIVWFDRRGRVHEHIVDEVVRAHDEDGSTYTTATCINSLNETWDDWIDDKRPSGDAGLALASLLEGTRWKVGSAETGHPGSKTFYHQSLRESIAELVESWGVEIETSYALDEFGGISTRNVNVYGKRGDASSKKRFTWTKDIKRISRTVGSTNVKTRVYGYGKGVETESGGFGRRLTIESVNGGKPYVEDAAATAEWGHPDADGNPAPACTSYVDEQCEDASQLLNETLAYLDTVSQPEVTYEASVIDLQAYGRAWEGVGVGDTVTIIDKEFSAEGVRLRGRVSMLDTDLLSGDVDVTFGTLTDTMADMFGSIAATLKSQALKSSAYDAVAAASPGWLRALQGALNEQFNAAGTYKVETFELGTIYANVPIDETTGRPLKSSAGMWAVNINGMGIRLAEGLTAAGAWDWKTFITGAGATADMINAGTMRADRIRTGLLTDEAGDNYWDLTTGEFRLAATATIGGSHIATDKDLEGLDASLKDAISKGATAESIRQALETVREQLLTDSREISSDWSKLNGNASLTVDTVGRNLLATAKTRYDTYIDERDSLRQCIDAITRTTGDIPDLYITDYDAALIAWRTARTNLVGSITDLWQRLSQIYAEDQTKALDNELTQKEIFDRLTNNGKTQGVYMKDGLLYINATYMATGTIADTAGRNSWNLTSGAFKTKYMTADSITANGTFRCGYTSYYTMLNSLGELAGYRTTDGSSTPTRVGYIDYTASMRDIDTGRIYYGIQMQAQGGVRISSPIISTAATSNTSVTATYGRTGTVSQPIVSEVHDNGNGTVGWHYGTFQITSINGLFTSYSTVGTG